MAKNPSMAPSTAQVSANISPTLSSAAQILAQTQMVAQAAQQPNLFRTQSLPTGNLSQHYSAFQIANAMNQPSSPGLIAQRGASPSRSPEPPSNVFQHSAFLEDGLSGLSTRDGDSE
jgi:hypothetical protein